MQKLHEMLPETADPEKGPALIAKLRRAAHERGFSDEQIRGASASQIVMLYEAVQYQDRTAADAAKVKAEAKAIEEAKKKAADAPPVQKPGVASQKQDKKAEKIAELEKRFEKSGKVDDLAALLEARG
jgi:hypothetical protein